MRLSLLKADCLNNQMQRISLSTLKCNFSYNGTLQLRRYRDSEKIVDAGFTTLAKTWSLFVMLGVILISLCTVGVMIKCDNIIIRHANIDGININDNWIQCDNISETEREAKERADSCKRSNSEVQFSSQLPVKRRHSSTI